MIVQKQGNKLFEYKGKKYVRKETKSKKSGAILVFYKKNKYYKYYKYYKY